MDNEELARLHAIVEGRVQGVGFRYFVVENARMLGLTGWVRNRWDDSVEVVAEGERHRLEQLLALLHQGPRSARVSKVVEEWLPPSGEFSSFNIRLSGI